MATPTQAFQALVAAQQRFNQANDSFKEAKEAMYVAQAERDSARKAVDEAFQQLGDMARSMSGAVG